MTCVVGLKTDNSIIFGSDTAGSGKNVIEDYTNNKIILTRTENDSPIAFAFQGSYRLGNILKHELVVPKISKKNTERDLVVKLVPLVKEFFDDEHENMENTDFLIGVHNQLYLFQGDFSILEPSLGYTALGSGIEYALGSLYSTKNLEPKLRVQLAVEAAKHYSPSVGGETRLFELKFND